MRGQVTVDFMFAITIIALTVAGLVSFGHNMAIQTNTLRSQTDLRILTISVRDDVAKVYAAGPGFTMKVQLPFRLQSGDQVNVTLNKTTDSVAVSALLGGSLYRTSLRLQVPLAKTTKVTLTPARTSFNVTARMEGGVTSVEVR
ncbi:MAG: hypothetical protein GXO14_06060 [Thermococci archaeon]|nr:hypothetical protein [Thermococci archaeon]